MAPNIKCDRDRQTDGQKKAKQYLRWGITTLNSLGTQNQFNIITELGLQSLTKMAFYNFQFYTGSSNHEINVTFQLFLSNLTNTYNKCIKHDSPAEEEKTQCHVICFTKYRKCCASHCSMCF